ncbi:Eco57I restriction-modification methylase domain-containing protein [Desulfobacterium sp. N47]|uniref:Eco57I restriction-modification methylase domain-containing protein n=1 Tax=Desulfobacterium sp. N47 TaxID=3115210 RepID=UPI003F4A5A43
MFKEANIKSVYYKAILQNLFFASLNCPIEPSENGDNRKRGFRLKDNYGQHRDANYLMRYKDQFKNPEKFLNLINEIVPFLNGGLFECLDNKTDKIYIDGFSDNLAKPHQLIVPDFLFFGFDREVDLSGVVGINTNAFKNANVKGLIPILESYKFTIAENTPIEEDVALDPELLGKVFENLLASYNPETKTTARKQTGSFYTPREIVNYMVDESLIAYLKNSFNDWDIDEEKLDKQLHELLSYDDINPCAENEDMQKQIIHALDNCKILDPACGSGAFPMGILQKMVHILQKVDPENEYWKELQLNKALKDTEGAFALTDKKEREQKLIEINEAFDEKINDPDYARKLFLVEDCIYGVDIQPIATQISKLRFFISLVVDQKVDKDKPNFGIRALPNLETKFVAANTLIGIDKPKDQITLFDNQEIQKLEMEMKNIRHRLFSAKSPATKRRLRDKDKEIREIIGKLLVEHGWGNETAKQLAGWDPYDQNASSPFFDLEWMFDIKTGFDVVIGNPPYKIVKSSNTEPVLLKKYLKFYSADFKVNIYSLFLEHSLNLGKDSTSIHSYIIPDTALNLPAFKNLRELLATKNRLISISYYDERVFENAEVGKSVILIYRKSAPIRKIEFRHFSNSTSYENVDLLLDKVQKDIYFRLILKEGNASSQGFSILESMNDSLDTYCEVYDGINPGSKELKETFINARKGENSKKVIDGKDFSKYSKIKWSGFYVQYDPELVEIEREKLKKRGIDFTARIIKKVNYFKLDKIVTRQTSDTIIATIDRNGFYTKNSVHSTLIKPKFKTFISLEYICALLNSNLIDWYYRTQSMESGRLFPQVKIDRLKRLPCPDLAQIEKFMSSITMLSTLQFSNENLNFINVINALIFELYFPEHMKEHNIDILQFVEKDIEEVMQGREFGQLTDDQKEKVINQLHDKWTDPESEIVKRINSFAEKSPDILKPIFESK